MSRVSVCLVIIATHLLVYVSGQNFTETGVVEKTSVNLNEKDNMVAVSSTVIPVAALFSTSQSDSKNATGTGRVYPLFRPVSYTRRSKFFDKSTKPDTPVRLITTKSKTRLDGNDG